MPNHDGFLDILAKIAPGTLLREALDSITRLGKGALILIADGDKAAKVMQGGFELNTELTPQKLTELSKMDRAIVVDESLKQILYANVLLVPDHKIPSKETGTRHRAAEIVAKQLQTATLAVSASKERVTLYYGDISYILPDFNMLTARINQALHILEQYRNTLDGLLDQLTALEFEGRAHADDVASVIQLCVQMLQVEADVGRWFIEMGDQKHLQAQLLEWLMLEVEVRFSLLLKDYQRKERKSVQLLIRKLQSLPREKLLETEAIMEVLGYEELDEISEMSISPRGYRVLHEIPRLPSAIAKRLVSKFGNLSQIVDASEEDLISIRGVGMVRARTIRAGLMRIKTLYNSIPKVIKHAR